MTENATNNVEIGKVIKSYQIEGLLGTGNFGAVYRAKQAVVQREVAIKIIWPAFANHPNFIRRFEAEAQLIAGLEHPYIVPLYDYWRDPDGAYIVMRWLRGGALRDTLEQEQWSMNHIRRLLSQISSALALAHRSGIVHRDIKPENILLDRERNAYLADFGIAQIITGNQEDDDPFISSMGSPAYASPEQLRGDDTTSQSDIYSLGIILYEMLTGMHPFPELENLSMTQLLRKRTTTPLPPLARYRPDLPAALNEVCQIATALDPRNRYPDAITLTREFQQASGGSRQYIRANIPEVDEILPNPYRGLRAFQETDAANFFGRETLVKRLLNRLQEDNPYKRFLAVVGPSGSGKSSLVKAGLIPSLRQGALTASNQWYYDEIVPGTQPFTELENALVGVATDPPQNLSTQLRHSERGLLDAVNAVLPDDETNFFLFIDQFEELFTLVEDDHIIDQFLDALFVAVTDPASRLYVVITIRADFYDRPLLQPRLSNLVRERTEVVVPLSATELERVIVEPARRAGVAIDSALVAAIVAEVKEQPGALPLLQYALSELFDLRENGIITANVYRQIGGVRGALAKRADELYSKLTPEEQTAVRQVFLRLITLGEGTEDTRRRALLTEVTSIQNNTQTAMIQELVDHLGKARLLTFDRDPDTRSPTIEVTHEAIIREWDRLRGWLDDSRNDVRMQRTLSSLASEWHLNHQDPSFLLRGIRLESYEKWSQTTNLMLTEQEQAYLEGSANERHQRELAEAAQEEREERLRIRSLNALRLLAIVLTIATLGAFALTGFAVQESNRANANAASSQSIAWEAGARRVLSDADGDLALLLALQANELDNPPIEAINTLSEVTFAPGTRNVLTGHTSQVDGVAISPNGQLLASGSTDFSVRIWDINTGEQLNLLEGHTGDITSIAFSPNGQLLVSTGRRFQAIVWDVQTGEMLNSLQGHGNAVVYDAVFSPDGMYLYTSGGDGELVQWDIASGAQINRFQGHQVAAVLSIDISPDGEQLLSGSRATELILWDTRTAAVLGRLAGHDSAVNDLKFSPDGTKAVSVDGGGEIILWDMLAINETISIDDTAVLSNINSSIAQPFFNAVDNIFGVAFSPNGQHIYTASSGSTSAENSVYIWNAETGQVITRLEGHDDGVLSIAVSGTGHLVASGSVDQTIRLWNVGQSGSEFHLDAHTSRVTNVFVQDDLLYTASADNSLRVWDADTGREVSRIEVTGMSFVAADVSPNGERALLGSRNGVLIEVEMETNVTLNELSTAEGGEHNETVEIVTYLDDERALSAGLDNKIILWDMIAGRSIRTYEGHTDGIYDLAVFPDGTQFASASIDGTVRIWNLATGETSTILTSNDVEPIPLFSIDVNSDGSSIATGRRDGVVILWDVATGAETSRFVGDTDTIWSVAFHSDGNRLLSGSADGVLSIWDIAADGQRQRFELPSTGIFAATFTPDGQSAVTGHSNGQVYVWRTFLQEELLTWIDANRYVRSWQCDELDQYRVDEPCE